MGEGRGSGNLFYYLLLGHDLGHVTKSCYEIISRKVVLLSYLYMSLCQVADFVRFWPETVLISWTWVVLGLTPWHLQRFCQLDIIKVALYSLDTPFVRMANVLILISQVLKPPDNFKPKVQFLIPWISHTNFHYPLRAENLKSSFSCLYW